MSDADAPSYTLAAAQTRASPPRASAAHIVGLPGVGARAKALLLALTRLRGGALALTLPSGETLRLGDHGPTQTAMTIRQERALRRIVRQGDIGLAEGYIEGEWTTPDLAAFLSFMAINADEMMRYLEGGWIGRFVNMLRHSGRANTRTGARRNILAHYDLGNDFYAQWLDPSMTYSAARFDEGARSLEKGQRRKYRAIADRLGLKPGMRVLEIGCGWGGFAEVAAGEYGARVTGLTISDAQFDYARKRMARQELDAQVDIQRIDYRDITGQFDAIVSIEMFEAVGEKYWPAYFGAVRDRLKPGGRAVLQIITIRDELFDAYRQRADFIQRFVFPGGMLPSLARLREETSKAGLHWRGFDAFGVDYADTLSIWAKRFSTAWPKIELLGFDARFKRLWLFYLAYCEAGFRTGRTDVIQLELARAA